MLYLGKTTNNFRQNFLQEEEEKIISFETEVIIGVINPIVHVESKIVKIYNRDENSDDLDLKVLDIFMKRLSVSIYESSLHEWAIRDAVERIFKKFYDFGFSGLTPTIFYYNGEENYDANINLNFCFASSDISSYYSNFYVKTFYKITRVR